MEERGFGLSFLWSKPEIGYKWENCKVVDSPIFTGGIGTVPDGPYLIERDYSQSFNNYNPSEDGAVFANFGDIPSDESSLAAWASEYGPLVAFESFRNGNPLWVLPSNSTRKEVHEKNIHHSGIETSRDSVRYYAQWSSSLGFWQKEHRDISFAAMLWELITLNDKESLGKIMKWILEGNGMKVTFLRRDDLKVVGDVSRRSEIFFDGKNINPWCTSLFRYPDVIKPARYFLQTLIYRKLEEFSLRVRLTTDKQGDSHKRIVPSSLLSLMWYQAYLCSIGEIKLKRCEICHKWEDVSNPQKHRSTWTKHKVCADRQRLERHRQNQSKIVKGKRR
jgi:hypothetical protein